MTIPHSLAVKLRGTGEDQFCPVLLNICTKPLGAVSRGFGVWYHHKSDDTQLCFSVSLNQVWPCLDTVVGWMRANELKLNHNKLDVLGVGGFHALESSSLPVLDKVAFFFKEQGCSWCCSLSSG